MVIFLRAHRDESRQHRLVMMGVAIRASHSARWVAAVLLAATGFDVARALSALVSGAFGSWYAFGSGTLVRATPLLLTGLAVAIAFRAGVFNIGAEGQFLLGAAAATAMALSLPTLPAIVLIPAVLIAGSIAGAIWASIAAILRARFHVLE